MEGGGFTGHCRTKGFANRIEAIAQGYIVIGDMQQEVEYPLAMLLKGEHSLSGLMVDPAFLDGGQCIIHQGVFLLYKFVHERNSLSVVCKVELHSQCRRLHKHLSFVSNLVGGHTVVVGQNHPEPSVGAGYFSFHSLCRKPYHQ